LDSESGLSRAAFASRIGTSPSRLSTYVTGKVTRRRRGWSACAALPDHDTPDGGHEILPIGGHRISPLADTKRPQWRPSDLPTEN
jgi:hypothetical protein